MTGEGSSTVHSMRKPLRVALFGLIFLSVGLYIMASKLLLTHGLVGTYYANSQWKGTPQFIQIDPEISDEVLRNHRPAFPGNRFSVEWRGFIALSRSGLYTFATRSDDGSWLYIDDQLVVDNGGVHGLEEVRGQIQLERGIHEIRVRYFQAGGYSRMEMAWIQPLGISFKATPTLQRIPSQVLFPSPLSFRRYQAQRVLEITLSSLPILWGVLGLFFVIRWILPLVRRPLLIIQGLYQRFLNKGSRVRNWTAAMALVAVVFVFFYDVIFLKRTLLTTNLVPSTTPSGAYGYSGRRITTSPVMDPFASAWIHEPATQLTSLLYHRGILPLWDPHTGLGTPLNADMISTVFFPLSFLLYLTPHPAMWDFYLVFRIFLAGVLMYLFLKKISQLDQLSALVGGMAYMFCGHMVLHINIVFIHAAMLLPGLMYTTEKLYQKPGIKWMMLQGGMVGLVILGGHPEPSFFAMFFATGYYLVRCLLTDEWEYRRSLATSWSLCSSTPLLLFLRRLFCLAGSYGIGLLLCAIMVLPFLEFVQLSYLGRHDPNLLVGLWSLPSRDLILLALPYFFGPLHQSWDGVVWDFQPGYLGFGVALLTVLAILEGIGFRKNHVFFTLMITFFLIQGYNLIPSFHDFVGRLPFFKVSHFTRYFPPELTFSAVVLMSVQLSRIRQGKYRRWLLGGLVLLSWLLIGLLWKVTYPRIMERSDSATILAHTFWQTLPALVLGGLILLGLWLRSLKILTPTGFTSWIGLGLIGELFILMPHDHMDRYPPFVEPPFVKFLKSDSETFRVYALDGYLYPNTPSAYELNSIGFVNGLINRRFWMFAANLIDKELYTNWFFTGGLPVGEIRNVDNRFFNLLNLKYVVTDKRGAPPYFHLESSVYPMGGGAVPADSLVPGVSIGQTFISHGDLCAIGLFFGTYQRFNTGRVLFKLKESPTSETSLYTTWIPMTDIQDNTYYTVSFPPIPGSKDKTFYFELTAPEATVSNTVTLWTNQQDLYPEGQLYLNGKPALGDAGFKVYSFASQASFEEVYDGEVKIYRNHRVLPRAFIVHQAEVISDPEPSVREAKVLERLKDDNFDLSRQIILEKEPEVESKEIIRSENRVPTSTLPHLTIPENDSQAEIVRYEPTRVSIKTKTERPGFLVLSDPFYPGWRAYIDGKESEILLTNYFIRSVFLPPGEHNVLFKYEPTSYKVGAWLTLLGLSAFTATFSGRWFLKVRSPNGYKEEDDP